MTGTDLPRLSSSQAAARLGIKQQSLYAYVARGMLEREKGPNGSTFDALEVERFAVSRRPLTRAEGSDGRQIGAPLMVIDTAIALIEDDELYFRGRPAAELAVSHPYAAVAAWLWGGDLDDPVVLVADDASVVMAGEAVARLPAGAPIRDRIQVSTTVLGAADPLRYDLDPATVTRAAGRYLAGVVEALPDVDGAPGADDSGLAARLWPKLTDRPASSAAIRCLNAALVLLIDHDLAISTMAARAAASARANPYGVISCGLSALDSALHGNASLAAHRLLAAVLSGEDAERAIADTVLHGGTGVPGFGHRLYRDLDPRARLLFTLLRELPEARDAVAATDEIIAVVQRRTGRAANVDLALATLVAGTGMRPDAGEAIFAISRSAGWIAHALDEYTQPPLRLRPVGNYVGP